MNENYKYTRTTLNKEIPNEDRKIKDNHPQKMVFKKICDIMFYLGGGNLWYEDRNLTPTQQRLYNIYAVIVNVFVFGNCCNEYLAYLRDDLNTKEKNDLVQFTIAHGHVSSKILLCYLLKNRVRKFIKKMCEGNREFARLDIDLSSVKKAKRIIFIYILAVFSTLSSAFIDGVRMHIQHGIPIRTEIVLYPSRVDSWPTVFARVMIEVHWYCLMAIMICVETICFSGLVFIEYKFKTLAIYFKSLRQKYKKRVGEDLAVLEEDYIKDFLAGVRFHQEILWYSSYLQYSLGLLNSIQVTESVLLIVICLIKTVGNRDLTTTFANLAYLATMFVITGCYWITGGDIIFAAASVPEAIFHSGWEFTKGSKRLRAIVLVTLIRSQRRVFMTAFGLIELSYDNFISIIRSSYSFFAVMY